MVSALLIFFILLYLIIIGLLVYGYNKVEDFKLQDLPAKTKFSVVIPFRNETKNLPKLLDSISRLNYPKTMFEVILIDDGSEDDSVSILENVLHTSRKNRNPRIDVIRIIQNERTSNSPKKDAISTAIKASKYNWIVTTDADCILPKYWLDAFDECIQANQSNCIVAPVTYHGSTSFFNRFQTLDFLSLQGATIGGFGINKPFMCNGANFAYRKSEFNSVNGFEGNNTISSGDDIFLLEKLLKQDAKKVHYLKSEQAIVTTNPAQSTKTLIQQRLRWASKSSHYKNWFGKLVGLVVLFGNFACLTLIPTVFLNILSIKIAIALFVIKFSIDFLLLFKTSRFFKQEGLLLSYLFSSVIYPFFSVSVALLSFFKSYEWKGRKFRK
ncbi:glycosyltransferase family 2 protein [Winogradskyella forsetii]|uniref:glycosyltransferase family 2 protein n=1 Tax=Winogradskyella forsetii TaxID=2686077 RepID=UPI0015B97C0E|nr:glycosyltransferase [Winogradskyella forsetii]